MNWTEEQIDERNRKQAAQGFVGALGRLVAPATDEHPAIYQDESGKLTSRQPRREGRIKGIAAEAERTCNGRVYHSKAEAKRAAELDMELRAGLIRRVTPQVSYPIMIGNVKICTVVVDFEVEHNDGLITALEIKGYETDLYKLKAKLLRACYPKLNYVVEKV